MENYAQFIRNSYEKAPFCKRTTLGNISRVKIRPKSIIHYNIGGLNQSTIFPDSLCDDMIQGVA